jgi:hypothetical protein
MQFSCGLACSSIPLEVSGFIPYVYTNNKSSNVAVSPDELSDGRKEVGVLDRRGDTRTGDSTTYSHRR